MAWTETQVDMLKTLWAEGLSASQIAKQIGGVTRNAVIGKIHRLGLAARDKPSRQTKTDKSSSARSTTPGASAKSNRTSSHGTDECQTRPAKRTPITREPVKSDNPNLPQTGTASVQDIRDSMCKWPIGDPGQPDFAFCGRPKSPGFSYCRAHAEIAYQPVRKRDAGGSQKPAAN